MRSKSGSSGTVTIGGVTIPIKSWRVVANPPKQAPSARKLPPHPMVISFTLTWDATPWTWESLEDRRWADYLARQFRGQPGMRFADLMRGVGRN